MKYFIPAHTGATDAYRASQRTLVTCSCHAINELMLEGAHDAR